MLPPIWLEVANSPHGCKCLSWFLEHGRDLLQFLASGGPPSVRYATGWTSSYKGGTGPPWDSVTLPDDAASLDGCTLGSTLLHEMAHNTLQLMNHTGFDEFIKACTVGCITPMRGAQE
jgi:hypothetical protein